MFNLCINTAKHLWGGIKNKIYKSKYKKFISQETRVEFDDDIFYKKDEDSIVDKKDKRRNNLENLQILFSGVF